MTKCVLRITWVPNYRPTPKGEWNHIEVDHPTFEEAVVALQSGRLVSGSILWTCKTDEPGLYAVYRRVPIAFSDVAVARVEMPFGRFCEAETEGASGTP